MIRGLGYAGSPWSRARMRDGFNVPLLLERLVERVGAER
jgi:hypothetical protein